jgi:undecaprenyl-diphosphatase
MLRATDAGGPVPTTARAALFRAGLLIRRRLGDAAFLTLAVGGAAALNILAKVTFQRSRPALWPTLVRETDYGFPSGHAVGSCAAIVALIILVWSERRRWVALGCRLPFVLLFGLSRISWGSATPRTLWQGDALRFSGSPTRCFGSYLSRNAIASVGVILPPHPTKPNRRAASVRPSAHQ